MLLTVFPMIVLGVVGGFGDTLKLSDVVLRYVLSVFPILRIICTFICLTYLVKNSYLMMACGVYYFIAGEMLWEMVGDGACAFLGITSLSRLFHFDVWTTYTLVNERTMSFYDSALPAGDALALVLTSVVFGSLFLLIGYLYFRKDDLN